MRPAGGFLFIQLSNSRAFCEELEKLGIAYTVSDRIPFVTPGDSIIKR